MVSWKHTYKISAKPRLDVQEQVYYFGVTIMEVSYKKLWILLVEKEISPVKLRRDLCIATGTMTKLRRNEEVALSVLLRICNYLNCNIGDICDAIKKCN